MDQGFAHAQAEDPPQQEQGQIAPSQVGIFIAYEEAEGGAILFSTNAGGRRSAVIAGDSTQPAFQRRVQKIAVRWTKEFFWAPPRQKKEDTPSEEIISALRREEPQS